MTDIKWYYEFEVKWFIDEKEQYSRGILYADTFVEAAEELEKAFGDELIEINYLKPIVEGPVFMVGANASDEDNLTVYPKAFLKQDQHDKLKTLYVSSIKVCN